MKKLYDLFKSQKFGIITGFTITGLLIIGSLIMNYRPGQYTGLSGDDLTFFFNQKKPIHIWFYLLFLAFIFYGVNTFLCTLDSVLRKIKGNVKKVSLYGASVVHIGFITTLLAHLIGGLYSSSKPPVTIGAEWTDMGGFEMKVTDLKTSSYPNGMPKKIVTYVAVRKDGVEYSDTLGYNNPVLLQNGVTAVLMRDYGMMASGAVLDVDGRRLDVNIGESFDARGVQMRVTNVYMPPQYRYPVIKLVSVSEDDKVHSTHLPIGESNGQMVFGVKVAFTDIKSAPGVLAGIKENPSIPLSLVTVLFFSVGMGLVILRIVGKKVYI
ncbi:MAG: hypothetical protein MRJ65_05425 [Candidatus Brocadiaceae bacterium]|nr:hypothetical protein [Candidatus Brocadiaceae bacterium]